MSGWRQPNVSNGKTTSPGATKAWCAPGVPGRSSGNGRPGAGPATSPGAANLRAPGNGHAATLVTFGGTTFQMGTDDREGFPADGEGPVREVYLSPFRIDRYAVSNAQFAAFVEATGYQTEAERFGWSFVFRPFVGKATLRRGRARSEALPLGW